MKRKLRNLVIYILILTMLMEVPVYAEESGEYHVTAMDGVTVLFTGTKEECETYLYHVMGFRCVGSGHDNGTVICLSYRFGKEGIIKFEFENKNKMIWVDGSEWDISYNGSLDYDYIRSTYSRTDDAIRAFCPEFANTHSLIPSNVPENFERVLSMANEQAEERKKTLSKTAEKQTDEIKESLEAFDERDYIRRYPDVAQAVGADKLALFIHYQTYGKEEGRKAVFN